MNDETTSQAPALSPAQRKALKAQAHPLKPVVMIGDAGLSEPVIAEIERALTSHELIKIRVLGDDRDARVAMLETICARTGAAPVQHIGKLLVVWRERPEESAASGPGGRARPNEPYRPKKALGAGESPSARRRAGASGARGTTAAGRRTSASGAKAPTASRSAPSSTASPGARARPTAAGAKSRAGGAKAAGRATPLARGAGLEKAGRSSAPVNVGRAPRPGRAPTLASPAKKRAVKPRGR